jgi:hypothetical protein
MTSHVTPVLFFVGIVVVILVAWCIASVAEKKRRAALAGKALEMGLLYSETAPHFLEGAPPFKLFQRGRARKARNLLSGSSSGFGVAIADYQYTVSSGKSSQTHRQTVCLLQADGVRLPHCFLRREVPFFDAIGQKLGGQDIDYPEDAAFSKAFVLQGEDPEATRRAFDAGVRTHLMRFAGTGIELEARGDTLLLHRGAVVKPEELRDLLQQAIETFTILRRGT